MLQDTVVLSTNESEYMFVMEGIKEDIWLHMLIQSLSLMVEKLILNYDSQIALSLIKNLLYHEKKKHIDVKLNFIQDILE